MDTTNNLYVAKESDGKVLSIAGGKYRIVISGDQTNDEFAVVEMTVPPNAGPVPHAHKNINESFYVLDGTVVFYTEEGTMRAEKGTYINIPRGGLVHNFKNETETEAVLLCTVMPAGMEKMFLEVSEYFERNADITDEEKKNFLKQLAEKYGTELYAPDYLNKK